MLASTTSDDLIGTGFGFAITSTDTINGITLEISQRDNSGINTNEQLIRLLKAGVAVGTNKSTGATLNGGLTTVTYGSSADLWGTTWTPADINNANFGAVFVCSTTLSGIGASAFVDFFRITVTSTTVGGATSTATMMMVF